MAALDVNEGREMSMGTNLKSGVIILVFVVGMVSIAAGRTIYVDGDGPADFNTIQAAIDDAYDGDTIIVSDGTYTGGGNRDLDFLGKAIALRSENGPENCIIDCNGTWTEYHRGFYFHSGEDANSIVDGFTITNGYAVDGGGIKCCYSSSPIISNCVIMGNSFNNNGGGIYCRDSSPMLTNCTFNDNWNLTIYIDPPEDLRGCGGGMCNYENSSPILSNCTFSRNIPAIGGGGIVNYLGSNPMLTNCIFYDNWAEFGGGMCNVESSPTLTNCTFSSNDATWCSGMLNLQISSPKLTNCILWDGGDEIQNYGSTITITYSDVQGGSTGFYLDPNSTLNWGVGNIDADPCFADAVNSDYHLKSQAGRWNPNSESWVQDDVTSPCIDAGNPGCPLGDEPVPNGNRRNMGAYGGTAGSSKSPANWRSIGDMTNDWILDSNDLKVFIGYWLERGECIPSDLDRNQLVDFNDFALLAGRPEVVILDCLLTTAPEYPLWVALGKPECWCYPRQCHGDADGMKNGRYYWVGIPDLEFFLNCHLTPLPDPLPFGCACADFNHDGKVDYIDSGIIENWYGRLDVPADCEGILYPLGQLHQISENWLEDNNL
jgi:parallel beta-helix repeat protein